MLNLAVFPCSEIVFIIISFLEKNWVPRAVYDCPLGWKRRKYNRSPVKKLWPYKVLSNLPINQCLFYLISKVFINFSCTNFYFYLLSKVFMTVLHQKIKMTNFHKNMTNDHPQPKFQKWQCSTDFFFIIFICSFLWIFHAPWSVKIGEKPSMWFFQSSMYYEVLSNLPINQFLFLFLSAF